MSTPAAPDAPPARQPLLIGVNATLALWGLLAFVSGFLVRYRTEGDFAALSVKGFSYPTSTLLPAILLGTLGLVGAVSRTGPRQVYLLAAAGAAFVVEIGELLTFDVDFEGESRGAGYWLLFVAVVLELLTTAVGALVQTGLIAISRRPKAPPPIGYAGPPAYDAYGVPIPSAPFEPAWDPTYQRFTSPEHPSPGGYHVPPPPSDGWQRPPG